MNVEFTETAWEDLTYWVENDLSIVKKIKELISSIIQTPTKGIGKPEPLKHEFKGCWSRRINREHRLVYKIFGKKKVDQKCIVLQCRYHYDK
jgi:toxin YoeB